MKHQKYLTEYQKEFIKDNFKKMRDIDIGKELELSIIFLQAYRNRMGYLKKKRPAKILPIENEFFNVDLKENWAI